MVFNLSSEIFQITGMSKRYIGLNLPYGPIKELRESVEKFLEKDLSAAEKERGKDAHITVITKIEQESLEPIFPVKEIIKIFKDDFLKIKFKVECLGQGSVRSEGDELFTYFLVIQSKDLVRIREKIQKEFEKRGGEKSQFKPKKYYPHVTIGYTEKDLHLEDGVVKDKESCFAGIHVA